MFITLLDFYLVSIFDINKTRVNIFIHKSFTAFQIIFKPRVWKKLLSQKIYILLWPLLDIARLFLKNDSVNLYAC